MTSRQNPDWYGTIYGNGEASITGWPGVVNIYVNMATAPRSTFTFVLSDRLDAEDYSFLTFRDVHYARPTGNQSFAVTVNRHYHSRDSDAMSHYKLRKL